jgi:hypothetical protein
MSGGPKISTEALRREWAETPPDVSYRFVVSLATLRAADVVARGILQKERGWWQRTLAFFVRDILRLIVGALVLALLGWLSWQLALAVDHAVDAAFRFGSGAVVRAVVFLVIFLSLFVCFRIAVRWLTARSLQRFYREFYADNEFLLEGRKSHLFFDEQSAGAIRRWSTFAQLAEFEEGVWLFVRRRTTFAGQRGILVSKESLPGSCTWSELKAYLTKRLEEHANDEIVEGAD